MTANGTTKSTAAYWLALDEARVSWPALRRAMQEQRGKYAAWVTARESGQQCDRPCCQDAAPDPEQETLEDLS